MFTKLENGLWSYESATPTTVYDVVRDWYRRQATNLYDDTGGSDRRVQPTEAWALRFGERLSLEEGVTVVFPILYIGDLLAVLRASYTNYYGVGMHDSRCLSLFP